MKSGPWEALRPACSYCKGLCHLLLGHKEASGRPSTLEEAEVGCGT